MIHRYTRMAEGLPPDEHQVQFRREYCIIIGLPYLPKDAADWLGWLQNNMVVLQEAMGICVDIFILLYAEAYPCSWGPTLQF